MIKKLEDIDFEVGGNYEIEATFLHLKSPGDKNSSFPLMASIMLETSGESIDIKSFDHDLVGLIKEASLGDEVFSLEVRASLYRGSPQLLLTKLYSTDKRSTIKIVKDRSSETIMKKINSLVNSTVENEIYLSLLKELLNDDFYHWVAAISIHHNFFGGLAYHSYYVAKNAHDLAKNFIEQGNEVSLQTVVTGALLHDIGKIREYTREGEMETGGHLGGHLLFGVEMINEACQKLNIDPKSEEIQMIKHIIASHHGDLDKGAIVTPATPEARLVADADSNDAAMEYIFKNTENLNTGEFTQRLKLQGNREFYKTTIK